MRKVFEHGGGGICDDQQYFRSTLMHAGDLSLFRGDCLHFGPSNSSSSAEARNVLFVMLTPDGGPDDSKQDFIDCP